MGTIPQKFNLDHTVTKELDRKAYTSSESQNLTKEMLSKSGKVKFNDKDEGMEVKEIEIFKLGMKINNTLGSHDAQELYEGLLDDKSPVSSATYESNFMHVIESHWNSQYYKVFLMIIATKIVPSAFVVAFI